jgi:2-polyprenyl-3-methyl-5-hydroxy-6-metoxy-1,4-benzoquinol methylase
MNLFFSTLMPESYKIEGDIFIENEIKEVIEKQSILFYPSSGSDIDDLFYANSKRIEEIGELSPNVFIHSDFYARDIKEFNTNYLFDEKLGRHISFPIVSKLKYFNEERSINIYKLKQAGINEVKWLFLFRGYFNEEILHFLFLNEIKVPLVYSVCDGITSGMGGVGGIPTILYPLFASELGLKFIITEYGWSSVKMRVENPGDDRKDELRNWLKTIVSIISIQFINDIFNLPDEELRKKISQKLSAIDEQLINREGVFNVNWNNLVIKKIHTMNQPHDSWATHYDWVYERTYGPTYEKLTDYNIKVIQHILSTESTIFDFGAGTGRLSIPLTQEGYSITAIEKSEPMANIIKRKAEELNLSIDIHTSDIVDFRGGKADMAIALFTVLSYATTEEKINAIISNIKEHLNPNGYFFFDLPQNVFFRNSTLADINHDDFKRKITLSPNGNDIYIYSETCSGVYNGKEFNYSDDFPIRYWDVNYINDVLLREGFKVVNQSFEQFAYTGSTYKLYQLDTN